MGGWSTAVLAVICATVLAAIGWWGWSEWRAAVDRAEAARIEAEQAEQEVARQDLARLVSECRARIEAWDGGQREALAEEFGSYAEGSVEQCRDFVASQVAN